MTRADLQEPARSAPHDSGAPAEEPPHLPWWKKVDRTTKQQVGTILSAVVSASVAVAGLALLANFGSAAAPAVVPLWGTWIVIFVVGARMQSRRREENRLRREEWLRSQPPPAR